MTIVVGLGHHSHSYSQMQVQSQIDMIGHTPDRLLDMYLAHPQSLLDKKGQLLE